MSDPTIDELEAKEAADEAALKVAQASATTKSTGGPIAAKPAAAATAATATTATKAAPTSPSTSLLNNLTNFDAALQKQGLSLIALLSDTARRQHGVNVNRPKG
jgi:hypothetical protein